MSSLFNNANTTTVTTNTTSIFGNQNQNQNPTTSLFGNNNNTTSLFGNNNNTTSLFGNNNNTTSLFGNNTNTSSLFGNNNMNNKNNNSMLTFGNNSQIPNTNNIGLFGTVNNNNNLLNNNLNNMRQQVIMTSVKPVLTIPSSNNLRFAKLNTLDDFYKKITQKIQLDLINNSIQIQHAENIIKKLEENFKIVRNEGINAVKFSKVIDSKLSKIKLLLSNLHNEMKKLEFSLDKQKNNFRIIEQQEDINLTIPDDFLLDLIEELEQRMISYSSQIEDIQTLVNLYYSEENGNFNINSDMIEELIVELYQCIKMLLNDEAAINDYVNTVKDNYIDYLKSIGFNDYAIKSKFDSYLNDDNQNFI